MSNDISKMTREQLKMHISSLEFAVKRANEELEARTDEDILAYGVPVFTQIREGVWQDRYFLYRTGPEAYDNAHKHRVIENPLTPYIREEGERIEDDWESRYKVESFYMHKDWTFADGSKA
jgi:hypothetical protein